MWIQRTTMPNKHKKARSLRAAALKKRREAHDRAATSKHKKIYKLNRTRQQEDKNAIKGKQVLRHRLLHRRAVFASRGC